MLKITDRDVKILLNTIACGLIFIALLQAFGPYLGKPDPQMGDIRQLTHRLVHVGPKDTAALLQRPDGKPVMLVVYASWCPYCKILMPRIAGLLEEHRLDTVAPVFISVDERPDFLAMYLVHGNYQQLFTPYISQGGLGNVIKAAGGHFTGAIPYIGFFDAHGKMLTEFPGSISERTLLATVEHIKETR